MEKTEVAAGTLTEERLADVLELTGEQVRRLVDAGMPRRKDGSYHLIHVTAWLARFAQTKQRMRGD